MSKKIKRMFVHLDEEDADFFVDIRTDEQRRAAKEWAENEGGCDGFEPDWDAIEKIASDEEHSPKLVTYRKKEDSPTLEEAQKFIGGYIEIVHTKTGAQLIIDEIGGLKALPPNKIASQLYGGPIVGPAIVLIEGAKWT